MSSSGTLLPTEVIFPVFPRAPGFHRGASEATLEAKGEARWAVIQRNQFHFCFSSLEDMFVDFRESERERNINWVPPVHAPTRDQTCNLGMCPDRGLSTQHFCV